MLGWVVKKSEKNEFWLNLRYWDGVDKPEHFSVYKLDEEQIKENSTSFYNFKESSKYKKLEGTIEHFPQFKVYFTSEDEHKLRKEYKEILDWLFEKTQDNFYFDLWPDPTRGRVSFANENDAVLFKLKFKNTANQ